MNKISKVKQKLWDGDFYHMVNNLPPPVIEILEEEHKKYLITISNLFELCMTIPEFRSVVSKRMTERHPVAQACFHKYQPCTVDKNNNLYTTEYFQYSQEREWRLAVSLGYREKCLKPSQHSEIHCQSRQPRGARGQHDRIINEMIETLINGQSVISSRGKNALHNRKWKYIEYKNIYNKFYLLSKTGFNFLKFLEKHGFHKGQNKMDSIVSVN